jgi:hypothetical protein
MTWKRRLAGLKEVVIQEGKISGVKKINEILWGFQVDMMG